MDEKLTPALVVAAVALLVGIGLAGAIGLFAVPGTGDDPGGLVAGEPDLQTFASDEEFQEYFEGADQRGSIVHSRFGGTDDVADGELETADGAGDAQSGEAAGGHSETNVQVKGIDEPDLLKTDGDSVYYARHHYQRDGRETNVLNLSDPGAPEVVATIPAAGELLLVEETDTLVVFDSDRLWGYDVSDPSDPEQAWTEPLDAHLQTARLHDGSLYLVLVDRPDRGVDDCPIEPYGGEPIECSDVYRPDTQADADAVYTAARVNPETGELTSQTSVVGSVRHSATYVSENAIYLSYTRSTSEYDLLSSYLTGPGASHLDETTVERIESLDMLDISERAKTVELHEIMEDYLGSLDTDERRSTEEALGDGLAEHAAEHQRDLSRTGIVRISIDGDLDVTANGEVPGYPLNQWSLDEHDGHLRIATTIPRIHGADSVNDVYVLDDDLEVTGSVQGLGETERIYSIRFEGDQGYVVTFRQIDPFYTLDLSDPNDPVMEGELKIPGFSNYLHPLDEADELILGVGQEDRKLKLSLFDASDRMNPEEIDALVFEDEHRSEVNQNHRAFLHDERHEAFFLPAGEASYVYSYADGELTEEAQIDVGGPGVRAMYVDEYLYVFGPEEVVVLDRTTWEVETRIDTR